MESFFPTLLFTIWGLVISVISEAAFTSQFIRKYSLPILLASIPTFIIAVSNGLFFETALGLVVAGCCIHLRNSALLPLRGWLWALALFSFIIAYLPSSPCRLWKRKYLLRLSIAWIKLDLPARCFPEK
jgi:hypothetical protein